LNSQRVRELGISPGIIPPGPLNAITDVAGVRVGHVTLIEGDGPHAVRTGVTAILPHQGNLYQQKVMAAVHTINGYGKAIGFEQVRELGQIESPIALTNTASVGLVADALITWTFEHNPKARSVNVVVGECNDDHLNDIRGQHVRREHVWQAIAAAAPGPVAEGNVGAGTGMVCFGFKGGVGTASRRLDTDQGGFTGKSQGAPQQAAGGFTVGALVVANFGQRSLLRMDGLPVGRHLADWNPEQPTSEGQGSIVMVVATDAPLTSRQLLRLAKRAGLGLARTGTGGSHGSGDFVIAFSTANRSPLVTRGLTRKIEVLTEAGEALNPLFLATVEAVEEAILNALCAAETMTGRDGHTVHALSLDILASLRRTSTEGPAPD
jgi:D-aminopeptidase